ncbi:hypothetical protein B296_00041187 [Ensete ventricosum]|uniref:Rx N-terminal domain-containing protein n=1 Tax=Ensete ventricosum TaxID=4639 RepID=A0A426XPM6_ENSVE|nr:hypothetical protein B296_00041187 [Ensete ventricosum]
MAASPVTAAWNVRTSYASFYLPPAELQADEREFPTVPQPSTVSPDTTAFYAQDSGEEVSTTQFPADLMIQLRDAIDAADDLVDELHYKALHEQVEQMTGAAADQEGSEIQLNVFRGFQTGGDDVANQGSNYPSALTAFSWWFSSNSWYRITLRRTRLMVWTCRLKPM